MNDEAVSPNLAKITFDLTHCYGIKRLQKTLEFPTGDGCKAFAIYAKNGTMKSSLALALADLQADRRSVDRIFQNRKTTRFISDANGNPLEGQHVIAFDGNGIVEQTQSFAPLLMSKDLRSQYLGLAKDLDKSKAIILRKVQIGLGKHLDAETTLLAALGNPNADLMEEIYRRQHEIPKVAKGAILDAPMADLFDPKARDLLQDADLSELLAHFTEAYQQVLDTSPFFKPSGFDLRAADQVMQKLRTQGFFDGANVIELTKSDTVRLGSEAELRNLLAKERERIAKDPVVREKMLEIEKRFAKHKQLNKVAKILRERPELVRKVTNLDRFAGEVAIGLLVADWNLVEALMQDYGVKRKELQLVLDAASKEETLWHKVVRDFKRRFHVPFEIAIDDQTDLVLGKQQILVPIFHYRDGDEKVEVERDFLHDVLSGGERRAMFLLDIIYEVELRKLNETPTLFVADDIADSFDYRNKYAILQYIYEISRHPIFFVLVLTHNFDFFRTVDRRLEARRLEATSQAGVIQFSVPQMVRKSPGPTWKPSRHASHSHRYASIPLARNLLEQSNGLADPRAATLTSLLHIKSDSGTITQSQADGIMAEVLGLDGTYDRPDELVHVGLRALATILAQEPADDLSIRVSLAMDCRLAAEEFMINRLQDPNFVGGITGVQTGKLLNECHSRSLLSSAEVEILDRIHLMTPEQIHLNAFMYEPLIDLDGASLKQLHVDVLMLLEPKI